MRLVQIVMTAVLAAIAYFLVLAFTDFGRQEWSLQMIALAGMIGVSLLIARKMFP